MGFRVHANNIYIYIMLAYVLIDIRILFLDMSQVNSGSVAMAIAQTILKLLWQETPNSVE